MGTIDLNLLPLFAAVAETFSFSAAAEKLGLPKSSVSRGIASLEEEMGVRLFHRTTRHVALSTAGAALLDRISSPLALLQESVGALPELEEEPSGRLRVTAAVDFGATVLAEIVTRFVARYPKVDLDLRLTNARVDLVAAGFDVALRIATTPLKDSALVARNAGVVTLQLYASPSYLALRGMPRAPRDLAAHSWVLFPTMRTLRLAGPGKPVTIVPEGRIQCDDMFFVREALRHGSGIGMLPSFLADGDVSGGHLVRVLPRWNVPTGQLWLIYHGAVHLPRKVLAFRDFVLDALKLRPLG
ncbi:MAG: LysR substrate-binding domain-containing protein [Polyangiaceae bacterium]